MLGLLRGEGDSIVPDLTPQPGTAQLPALVERMCAARTPGQARRRRWDAEAAAPACDLDVVPDRPGSTHQHVKHAGDSVTARVDLRDRLAPSRSRSPTTVVRGSRRWVPVTACRDDRAGHDLRRDDLGRAPPRGRLPREGDPAARGAQMTRIRVLIVDDQALGTRWVPLDPRGQPDLDVVGEAEDGREAVEAVASSSPDVMLMDIRMPRMDGIAATAGSWPPSGAAPGAHADHVRPRRVRVPGAACRSERLPAQGALHLASWPVPSAPSPPATPCSPRIGPRHLIEDYVRRPRPLSANPTILSALTPARPRSCR